MQSDDTGQARTTMVLGLTVAIELPLALAEQIEQGLLKPEDLFDVTLRARAENDVRLSNRTDLRIVSDVGRW